MTTTTRSRTDRQRAFTLTEVLVAATIGSFVLVAVLSTFLFLGRAGANIANYADMESQARAALEIFAEDTRMAREVTWHSAHSVSLVIPTPTGSQTYRYTYVPDNGVFTRELTSPAPATASTETLISGVQTFEFRAYKINTDTVSFSDLAAAGRVTKQIQISLSASRTSRTVTTATNTVLSARFILRNKRVTT